MVEAEDPKASLEVQHLDNSVATSSVDGDVVEKSTPLSAWLVVLACCVYYATALSFVTVTGNFRTQIVASLGGETESLWVPNSPLVVVVILGPSLARVGDSIGAVVFGVSFSILANLYAASSEVVSRHHRGTANSLMELSSVIGVWIALFPGSALVATETASYAGWRSITWLLAAMYVLSGGLLALLYWPVPPSNPRNLTVVERLLKIDLMGTLLWTMAFTPIIAGLVFGGAAYPWKSAATLVPLVVGLFFAGVFVAHQVYWQKDGILSHKMFTVYIVYNAYYGIETSAVFESRPYQLAARYGGFGFGIVLVLPFYAVYVYRTKQVKAVLIVGYSLLLIGGIGNAQTFFTTIVQLAVPPEYVGLASSLTQTARFVGGTIGVAISGAIFTSKIETVLPNYITTVAVEGGLPTASIPGFVAAIAGVIGLVGCLFITSIKRELNGVVDRPSESAGTHRHHEQQKEMPAAV
ncbi:hypothetical protein RQP46_002235 [Phenoliferia psychrophenolica]